MALLRLDEPRAWRFLDVTGVLQRALPEVATAMDRRRADLTDLDPLGALRFAVVDRLHHDVATHSPEFTLASSTELLALAALVSDVASMPPTTPMPSDWPSGSRRRSKPAGSCRWSTTHGCSTAGPTTPRASTSRRCCNWRRTWPTRPTPATLPAGAGDRVLSPVQWERLDLLYRFVCDALGHPEIVSSSATNLAGARLAAHSASSTIPHRPSD
ncbi:MAG: hypothetical protein R2713_09060 [Ilumatobacteraceae bacterium]